MTVKRLSNLRIQYDDGTGVLASNYRLFFYAAGSSTKQNTYNSSAGTVANSNPIVLNALGEPAVEIWLTAGQTYKIGLAIAGVDDPPASFVWTEDNISGINDTTLTIDEWLSSGQTPTYVSATSFTMPGDQTSEFHVGRRLKTTNSGGTIYSTIITSAFAASTTITVANDSGVLDVGLSAVSYGIARANNPSVSPHMVNRKGTAVASAGTTNIWGIVGDYVHITGTTGITSFGTAPYAGVERTIVFDGALTLTHNATTLVLPGGANITTAAGDTAVVRADTTANMVIISYTRASGLQLFGTQTANTILAGPTSGAAAVPAFRALVGLDGGTYVTLGSLTASASAQLDFTSTTHPAAFDGTYDEIVFDLVRVVPATDNVELRVRFSQDGGSTFKAGATDYRFAVNAASDNTAAGSGASGNQDHIRLNSNAVNFTLDNQSSDGWSGTVTVIAPNSAANHKYLYFTGSYLNNEPATTAIMGAGRYVTDTNAVNGIRFIMSSGNIASGVIYIRGKRKS